VRIPGERKIHEIFKRLGGPVVGQNVMMRITTKDLDDFQIEQVGIGVDSLVS